MSLIVLATPFTVPTRAGGYGETPCVVAAVRIIGRVITLSLAGLPDSRDNQRIILCPKFINVGDFFFASSMLIRWPMFCCTSRSWGFGPS